MRNNICFLTATGIRHWIIALVVALSLTVTAPAQKPAKKGVAAASKGATCDSLAGHPNDKAKIGQGVADGRIIAKPAIEKCLSAVAQQPEEARLYFQLGRSYWAAKRYDEALEAFLKAEEKEYAPAYYYLGSAYENGIAGKTDAATARSLYLIAAADEFAPAVEAYKKLIGDAPDFSEFQQAAIMQALYEGDLNALNKNRRDVISYGIGIQNFISSDENEYDSTCAGISDGSVGRRLNERMYVEILDVSANPTLAEISAMGWRSLSDFSFISRVQDAAAVRENGTNDIYLLTYDYGTCQGEVVQKVYSTLKRFVSEDR